MKGCKHVGEDTNIIGFTARASVAYFPGDLIFQNTTNGYVNASVGAAYAAKDDSPYPWMCGSTETQAVTFGNEFLGVCMSHSKYGVTDRISIAQEGVFDFPLYQKGGVTYGATVSGTSHNSRGIDANTSIRNEFGSSSYNYTVVVGDMVGGQNASGGTIGYCVKTESGASVIRVRIHTKRGKGRPAVGSW